MAGSTVHLTDYSDNDGAKSKVILTGAIGDYGGATSVSANGTKDLAHRSELDLALVHGSFRVRIADLDKKIVSAFSHFPSNTSTCSGSVIVTGAAPIIAGSGTGSYRRISGSFNLTVTIDEVVAKSKCDASAPFLDQAVVISGSGSVSLG
ncbi:hypothetical protein GCM10022403_092500 [Streptomyces coacervatus]|uniref:Dirigent protein n=1 Tax=Streptomyces coacervatus TaxID=647381 RepID=A0ABP7JJ34_9ACTN|nr:hypothetical protein [Streptomyces coacervatus]MDF2273293.1 hypothetical protein [Streptomyces coacervatus]